MRVREDKEKIVHSSATEGHSFCGNTGAMKLRLPAKVIPICPETHSRPQWKTEINVCACVHVYTHMCMYTHSAFIMISVFLDFTKI